jgi:hypothetical protein
VYAKCQGHTAKPSARTCVEPKRHKSVTASLYNLETFSQRVALKAALMVLYTVKDLACTRRRKLFGRQGVHGALRDCNKMAGVA